MPGIAEELFVESEKIPLRLYCSICLDVAEEAIITQCDHLFCNECILQLQSTYGLNCECPNCRKEILPLKPATNARNFLSQQLVYCSEVEELRCGWTGKYSMYHTHRAKYCTRASQSDKRMAKNAKLAEIGHFSKEELLTMGVGRLRQILQEMITVHRAKVSDSDLKAHYQWRTFLEKSEYITAILQFESIYGISSQYKSDDDDDNEDNNAFPTTYDKLKELKIRELSQYLRERNIDPQSSEHNCIEKADLIRLVMRTQQYYRDVMDGKSYDPKLEKQQFSPRLNSNDNFNGFNGFNSSRPSQPVSPINLNENDDDINGDEEEEENMNGDDINDDDEDIEDDEEEKMEDVQQGIARNGPQRPSAYNYTADHLRQSSANRIDLNRLRQNINDIEDGGNGDLNGNLNGNGNEDIDHPPNRPSSSVYSHVFNDHQHSNTLNRGNLHSDSFAAMDDDDGGSGHHQSMYSGDSNQFQSFTQTSTDSMPRHHHHQNGHNNHHQNIHHHHHHHHQNINGHQGRHNQQHFQHHNNYNGHSQNQFMRNHQEQHQQHQRHHQRQHQRQHQQHDQQQQFPPWFPSMPQMPEIPQIPPIPPIPQMPNVSGIYNNAMSGVNAIFGGFPNNNGHH